MRLYSFVNFYLSSIQQGIQTGHLTDDMSTQYIMRTAENRPQAQKYREWISKHKTYIILNGGDHESIISTFMILEDICPDLELPYGCFTEPGLGDMMTCCGVVVPENYYEAMNYKQFIYEYKKTNRAIYTDIKESSYFYYNELGFMEYEEYTIQWSLIDLIKSKKLAN